jgi:hypothetical protein
VTESVWTTAILLAVLNKTLIDYLFAPIRQKFPDHDLWYVVYIAFFTGGALGLIAGVNLLSDIATMPELAGRILTGALIGGGANMLYDIAKRRNDPLPETVTESLYETSLSDLLKRHDTDAAGDLRQ